MQNPSARVVIVSMVPVDVPTEPLEPPPEPVPGCGVPLALGRGPPVSYTLRVHMATGLTRLHTPESVVGVAAAELT